VKLDRPIRRPCSSIRSQKNAGEYIVAASGLAGYGDNNEIKTVRFSSRFLSWAIRRQGRPGVGLMAPVWHRRPSPGQYGAQNPPGRGEMILPA